MESTVQTPGARREAKAGLLVEDIGRPLITPPKVSLAQVTYSATLFFPLWHLQSGVSVSAVSECRGRP